MTGVPVDAVTGSEGSEPGLIVKSAFKMMELADLVLRTISWRIHKLEEAGMELLASSSKVISNSFTGCAFLTY
ncbi:hypothetical protein KCP75_12500 [Salmonella enterica subsp. enterica]|nr:hypothetical protein KCP75_12500 [Salmonella enterica subsp. enterica]